MTEGSVSWNDYCPRCQTSTRTNLGFGKIRVCEDCQKESWELEYNTKIGGK